MPPNLRYALFMSLLVFIGVLGILVIVLLMGAWRRYLSRQQEGRERREQSPQQADIWQVSGQRLAAHDAADKDEDDA